MWLGIIIAILLCWTDIRLIVGIIVAFTGYELKSKKEQKIVELE